VNWSFTSLKSLSRVLLIAIEGGRLECPLVSSLDREFFNSPDDDREPPNQDKYCTDKNIYI
jgi:hypothetical protein